MTDKEKCPATTEGEAGIWFLHEMTRELRSFDIMTKRQREIFDKFRLNKELKMKSLADGDVNPFKLGTETSCNTGNHHSYCPSCNSLEISKIERVRDYKSEDGKYELRMATTEYECAKCKFMINHIDYVHNEGRWIECGVQTTSESTNIEGDMLGPI